MTDAATKALSLRWLEPSAASLAALCRPESSTRDAEIWRLVRLDPAFTLLTLRHLAPASDSERQPFPKFRHVDLLAFALNGLNDASHATGWVDWSRTGLAPLLNAGRRLADFSHRIALRCSACDPELAWAVGLVAPLGLMALAAIDPVGVERLFDDAQDGHDPATIQRDRWGLDGAAVARRLARSWELPAWLATVVGSLRLPIPTAVKLGADANLFAVVRLAAELAGRDALGLVHGTDRLEAARHLGLNRDQLRALRQDRFRHESERSEPLQAGRSQRPTEHAHLPDLLRLALELRRRDDALADSRIDTLHDAIAGHYTINEDILQERKLAALAEFAAGASHEINNPLAVISGQAQSLIPGETEPRREESLRSIIRQANRIHVILTELMQFARPSKPSPESLDVGDLLRAVIERYEPHASEKRVRVEMTEPSERVLCTLDARQIRMALDCLLRNAIEAAPEFGWVRVTLTCHEQSIEIRFEDSGDGPPAAKIRHLFDPFFSGRDAGRGRGLGLPTAWRLAQLHGGSVRYEPSHDGPTRFVLSLPMASEPGAPTRRCA